jgi:thiol-disulfide isomerase/thioredoxin
VTCCSDNLPTTNEVQPIECAALDKMISDTAYRGLVVAMASWCPPCREELPILAKLYIKHKEKGIRIMAISLDAEGPKAVQTLIDKLKIPFPVYWIGTNAVQHYKIAGVPTLMVYNQGGLIEKLPGSHSQKIIEKKLQALVAEPN